MFFLEALLWAVALAGGMGLILLISLYVLGEEMLKKIQKDGLPKSTVESRQKLAFEMVLFFGAILVAAVSALSIYYLGEGVERTFFVEPPSPTDVLGIVMFIAGLWVWAKFMVGKQKSIGERSQKNGL